MLGQGGADRVAVNLINELSKRGLDVRLALMKREGEFLHDIPPALLVSSKNVKSLWGFLLPLRKIIKAENPDVVFSLDGGVNILLGILSITSSRKCRYIVSERNVLFPPGKNYLKYFVFNLIKFFTFRFVDGITVVSEGLKSEVAKTLLMKKSKIRVVYNPIVTPDLLKKAAEKVDHEWFYPDRKIPVVVHAGRFVYQKDHLTLLKAFAEVLDTITCRLFLLGDGPLLETCRGIVREMKISEYVCFAGFNKNPFKYFASCDLFVLSSRHEGMPGVLIQAMACGAPVISTNCKFGPQEIINAPGKNGLLVPVGDFKKLADAMIKVLSDHAFKAYIASNARSSISRFEVSNSVNSYIEAILAQ